MHRIEKVRRRVRGAAPVVRHGAVAEVGVHLARVNGPSRAHEGEEEPRPLPARDRPRISRPRRNADLRARVHQSVDRCGHEAVVHEEVFFDPEPRVPALEVARAVPVHPVAEDQILGPRGGADGVGLNVVEPLDRSLQAGGGKERVASGESAEVVERHATARLPPATSERAIPSHHARDRSARSSRPCARRSGTGTRR